MESRAIVFCMSLFPLLLALSSYSCTPRKKGVTHSESKGQEQPVRKAVSLIGSWRACEPYPQGEIIGVRSSSITYTFLDEKSVRLKAEYYADDKCELGFTEQMAKDGFRQYEELNKEEAPQDVKQSVLDLAHGLSDEMPYAASKVHEGELGTLDFLSMKNPSYTSYRIENDTVRIASVCHDLIEEGCEPIGGSATERATDMEEAEILIRQKPVSQPISSTKP